MLLAGTTIGVGNGVDESPDEGLEDGALCTTKWGFMRAGSCREGVDGCEGEDTHDTESSILFVPLLF